MNKTYIVTGCAGFIGSYLTDILISQGHTVIGIDKMGYASRLENIKQRFNSNFFLWKKDIGNDDFILTNYYKLKDSKIDGIFHCAAESHVDNSISNPYPFIHSNVKGILNILELARKLNTKIVYVSTDEVIGSIKEGFGKEDNLLETNSVYSASKASGELLCRAYFATHKLKVCVTRCGNNFGGNQHYEKFVPKVILNALNDVEIPVYGDGKNIRQWTYVQNHVEDLINVMGGGEAGKIYHVGGGEHFTNNEIVDIILTKLNKPKSLIKMIEDRKGHDFRYAIEINEDVLAWRDKNYINFQDGINKTIEFYKKS